MDSPGQTLYNPGSTINLDVNQDVDQGQEYNEEEENEADKEENQRHQELEYLLPEAFDDLMEDDNESGVTEDTPFDHSVYNHEEYDNDVMFNHQENNYNLNELSRKNESQWLENFQGKTSTPRDEEGDHVSDHYMFQQKGNHHTSGEVLDERANFLNMRKNRISSETQWVLRENENVLCDQNREGQAAVVSNKHELNDGLDGYYMQPETSPEQEQERTENHAFIADAGNEDVMRLQILYDARGREIKTLNNELAKTKEDTDREIRILKHQLTLAQGDTEGIAFSMQQARQVLVEKDEENDHLKGQITALEAQISSEKNVKEELVRKLHVTEATISTMQKQITELSQSENLVRTREQHESIIRNLKLGHKQEMLLLNTEIDKFKHQLEEQKEENEVLQNSLKKLEQQHHELKLEKAETINRLTKSLETCQKQCQNLLEEGKYQETAYLKGQLKQLEISKTEADNYIKALEAEVKCLKSELESYEGVAKLGLLDSTKNDEMDDTIAQLGLKRQDRSLTGDDLTSSLKSELQKSIWNLRSRRNQLTVVQAQLASSEREIVKLKNEMNAAEERAKKAEMRVSELEKQPVKDDTPVNKIATLEKENCNLENEIHTLTKLVEEKNYQLENMLRNSQQLEEMKKEMMDQLNEKDLEKHAAVQKCREMCLQLHQDASNKLRNEIMNNAQLEKEMMFKECEEKITELKNENHQLTITMDEVKELYLKICEEKNMLENKLEEISEERGIEKNGFETKLLAHYQEEKRHLELHLQQKFEEQLAEEKLSLEESIYNKLKNQFEEEKSKLLDKMKQEGAINIDEVVERIKKECYEELLQFDQQENLQNNENTIVGEIMKKLKTNYEERTLNALKELRDKLGSQLNEKLKVNEKVHLAQIEELKKTYAQELEAVVSKTKMIYSKQKEDELHHREIENEHLKQEIQSLEKQVITMKNMLLSSENKQPKNQNQDSSNSESQQYPDSSSLKKKGSTENELRTKNEALSRELLKCHESENKLNEKLKKYQKNIQCVNKKHEDEIAKLKSQHQEEKSLLENEYHDIINNFQSKMSDLQEEGMKKTEEKIFNLKKQHEREILELRKYIKSTEKKNVYSQTSEKVIFFNDVQTWKEKLLQDFKRISEKVDNSLILAENFSKQKTKQAILIYHNQILQNLTEKLSNSSSLPNSFPSSDNFYNTAHFGKETTVLDPNLSRNYVINNAAQKQHHDNISSSNFGKYFLSQYTTEVNEKLHKKEPLSKSAFVPFYQLSVPTYRSSHSFNSEFTPELLSSSQECGEEKELVDLLENSHLFTGRAERPFSNNPN